MTVSSPLSQPQLPVTVPAAIARPAQTADPAKVAASARDFEAMAIGQLLQPMFETVDTAHGLFGGGSGEEAWKPMLVQEIAKQIEARGGLGLAEPVYEAMMRMQQSNPVQQSNPMQPSTPTQQSNPARGTKRK
jgi:flagellar protein FlgJ